jgi:hypothetical protein
MYISLLSNLSINKYLLFVRRVKGKGRRDSKTFWLICLLMFPFGFLSKNKKGRGTANKQQRNRRKDQRGFVIAFCILHCE